MTAGRKEATPRSDAVAWVGFWGATLAAVLAFVVFPSGAPIGAGALAAAFAAKGQIRRQLFWVSGVAIAVTLLYALFLLPAGFVVTGDDQGVPIN